MVISVKIGKISEEARVNNIRVERVATGKDRRKFVHFPWKIYQNDPYWVPPLLMDFKEKIHKKKNPFFEHAEMELFLACRDGQVTGRVAAILDENHNRFHDEKVVFFGLYESIDDQETADALLETVAEWGKKRGMEILRGPMSLSMNDECAFLLEGFDSPPVVMMPYNPRYYLELMENHGLVKAKDLLAYYMSRDDQVIAQINRIAAKTQTEIPFTLRPIDMKNLYEEAALIKHVYNNAWEKNWGFVPWTDKEIDYMAKKLKIVADPDLVIIAEHEGKAVAFAFALPNLNEVIKRMNGRLTPRGIFHFFTRRNKIKGIRALVFGILQEYRHTGISYLLYAELGKKSAAKGYEWCETSWQLEDNEPVNRFVASLGGRVYKKYRIFEKKIG
jgi:GNAT superfamily N-acetyltransferase